MTARDQEDLLQQFVEGTLGEEECEQVIALLKNNPQAFESFCEYAELDAGLQYLSSGPARLADGARSLNLLPSDGGRLMRTRLIAVITAAAAVLVAGWVLYLTMAPEPEPVLAFRTAPETRLRITHAGPADETPAPGTLQPGSRLVLDQGSVELTFASGVRAVIEGPADLTLVEKGRLHLTEGRGFFEVPPAAIGFAVHTPELEVTDLGTEFAVLAVHDAGDQVHVMKGRVEALNRNGLKNREILGAGDAREAGPAGRLIPLPLRPADFARALPGGLPYLHWSFEGDDPLKPGGTLVGSGKITVRTEGGASTPSPSRRVDGPRGRALRFSSRTDEVTTSWQGFTGRTPRTFACWVKLDSNLPEDWQPIVELGRPVYPEARVNSYWRVRTIVEPATGRCVLRVSYGRNWIDGSVDLADGRWHHVAICESRELDEEGLPKVRFYVDGREDPATRANEAALLPIETRHGVPLSIGCNTEERHPNGVLEQRSLRGSIDELFLFEGELSAEGVRSLMDSGTQPE